jgi:c-di-GMP-binding flagellar brake protein YcgR
MAARGEERREHKRQEVACPLWLNGGEGKAVLRGRTTNVSNGGVLVPIASGDSPVAGEVVHVKFSVPRSTPNTFLYEEFASPAVVVRCERKSEDRVPCVALRFEQPMDLGLEA